MQPWKLARRFTGTQGELRLKHKQINPAEKGRRNRISPLSVVSQWHGAPPLPLLHRVCFICSCLIFASTAQTKAGPPQGGKGFLQEGQRESSGEVNDQKIRLVWVGRDFKPLQPHLALPQPGLGPSSVLQEFPVPLLRTQSFQNSNTPPLIIQMRNPYFLLFLTPPLNSSRSQQPTNAKRNSGQNSFLFLWRS